MLKVWGHDFQSREERLDCTEYDNHHRELLIEELTKDLKALQRKAAHLNHSLKIALKAI